MASKTIVFDFDGVIHKYRQGWKDGSIYDEPNMRVIEYMSQLMKSGYSVAIVSTRDAKQVADWWNDHNFYIQAVAYKKPVKFFNSTTYIGVFNQKIPAICYIDDRAVLFRGNVKDIDEQITKFIDGKNKEENEYEKLSSIELLDILENKKKEFEELCKAFHKKYVYMNIDSVTHNLIKQIEMVDDEIKAVSKFLEKEE